MWKNARHDAKIPYCRAFAQITPAEDELLEQVNRPSGDVLTGRIASTGDVGIIPTSRLKKRDGAFPGVGSASLFSVLRDAQEGSGEGDFAC